MTKDYIANQHAKSAVSEEMLKGIHLEIYNRHFAWLTALRFQLRVNKDWESIHLTHNKEYRNKLFRVDEHDRTIEDAIKPYLSASEFDFISTKSNKAAQILALQSSRLKELLHLGLIDDYRHMELERIIMELFGQQGASERIKNFPYPRQFSSLNNWFIKIFVFLIPFGMLPEFEKIGSDYVWLTIPFATLSGWIFTTMERIGETSENPFEGSANDVPITTIAKGIEIDMLEMLDVKHKVKPVAVQNGIAI